jgi:hypothetical protein
MIDKMNLTDICSLFHPAATQYTFFSAAYRIFPQIDHIIGHKASLKKIEMTSCVLSNNNGIIWEVNGN